MAGRIAPRGYSGPVPVLRRLATLALAGLLACTGSGDARGELEIDDRAARAPVAVPDRDPPEVRISVGTDSALGVLSSWCVKDSCERRAPARPTRYLEAVESGLVLFATEIAPAGARVEVRRPPNHLIARSVLRPGTTMAARVDVPAGRHLVTLVVNWPGREARWVFGVLGPGGEPR